MTFETSGADENWGKQGPRRSEGRFGHLHPDFLMRKQGGGYSPPDPTLRPSISFHQNRLDQIKWAVIDHPLCDHPWYETKAKVVDQILWEEVSKDLEDPEGGAACLVSR